MILITSSKENLRKLNPNNVIGYVELNEDDEPSSDLVSYSVPESSYGILVDTIHAYFQLMEQLPIEIILENDIILEWYYK